jgi:hypothetical protein
MIRSDEESYLHDAADAADDKAIADEGLLIYFALRLVGETNKNRRGDDAAHLMDISDDIQIRI